MGQMYWYINQLDWTFNIRVMGKKHQVPVTSETWHQVHGTNLFISTRLDIQFSSYGQNIKGTLHPEITSSARDKFIYKSTWLDIQYSSNGQYTSSGRYFWNMTSNARDKGIYIKYHSIGDSTLELWAKHQVHVTSGNYIKCTGQVYLYINELDWTFNIRVMGKNIKCTLHLKKHIKCTGWVYLYNNSNHRYELYCIQSCRAPKPTGVAQMQK
jgi:hypothetical protein